MIHNFNIITANLLKAKAAINQPRGFTLVELLVTISIFLVLITLTATLIRRTTDSEKIRTAASQLQAYVEGARARAFQQKKPIGIRFILDKDDPSTASSMVYLETSAEEPGQLHFFPVGYLTSPSGSLTTAQIYTPATGYLATNHATDNLSKKTVGFLSSSSDISWSKLYTLGLLKPGVEIKIENGRPQKVSVDSFYNNIEKEPVSAFKLSSDTKEDISPGSGKAGPFNYTLFPAPTPMKNVTPTELPRGTTIDFQSSKLPGDWGSIKWTSGYLATNSDVGKYVIPKTGNTQKRFFKIAQAGTAGTTEPNWDSFALGTTITDGSGSPIKYDILSTAQLDIMFSPSGAVDGAISAEGVLRFVLAEKEDTDANLDVEDLLSDPADSTSPPRGDQIIVSLYTLSGALSISQIDPTDSDNDKKADNAFNFAEVGEESK